MQFDLTHYTIRRKFWKVFGASFHVFDPPGRVVGYSKQKAFRLREDIRVYSDESMREEILVVKARQIIDFSAAYDIVDATEGRKVGAARRKGWSSMIRDSWEILNADDVPIGRVREDSTFKALLRRFLSNLIPQTFHLEGADGRRAAELRVHFNPFLYRMTVTIDPAAGVDPRLVFGTAVLLCAIEGRQQ